MNHPTIEDLAIPNRYHEFAEDALGEVTRLDLAHALGLVEECGECGGTGRMQSPILRDHKDYACPACHGSGVIVSPEAVERAAEALFALRTAGMPVAPFGTYADDEQYRTQARAGLRAVLGFEDE